MDTDRVPSTQPGLEAEVVRLRQVLQDNQSEGWTDFYPLSVTDAVPSQETVLDRAAQSISLINDGPGEVLLSLNERQATPAVIKAGEPFSANFAGHKLLRFYIKCPPTQSSACRVAVKG